MVRLDKVRECRVECLGVVEVGVVRRLYDALRECLDLGDFG